MIDLLTAPKIGQLPDGPRLSRLRLTEVAPHIEGTNKYHAKGVLGVGWSRHSERDVRERDDKQQEMLVGNWWERAEVQRFNHLMFDGKDFHLMTPEEYYHE